MGFLPGIGDLYSMVIELWVPVFRDELKMSMDQIQEFFTKHHEETTKWLEGKAGLSAEFTYMPKPIPE